MPNILQDVFFLRAAKCNIPTLFLPNELQQFSLYNAFNCKKKSVLVFILLLIVVFVIKEED